MPQCDNSAGFLQFAHFPLRTRLAMGSPAPYGGRPAQPPEWKERAVLGLTEVTDATCSNCYFGTKQLCSLKIEGKACPTYRPASEYGRFALRTSPTTRLSPVDPQVSPAR